MRARLATLILTAALCACAGNLRRPDKIETCTLVYKGETVLRYLCPTGDVCVLSERSWKCHKPRCPRTCGRPDGTVGCCPDLEED